MPWECIVEVSDLLRSIEFYGWMGFKQGKLQNRIGQDSVYMVRNRGYAIYLVQEPSPTPTRLIARTTNLASLRKEFKEMGLEVSPLVRDENGIQTLTIVDPDGHTIIAYEDPDFELGVD